MNNSLVNLGALYWRAPSPGGYFLRKSGSPCGLFIFIIQHSSFKFKYENLTGIVPCTIISPMDITKTIVLVRHGSTAHNDNNVWQGRSDSSLNDKGRKEAEILAEELKNQTFDIVFHSPMKRTRETAEIIAKNHNAIFKAIDCFIEIDVGEFDGAKNSDIIEQHPEIYRNWIMDIDCPMPAGESFNDVFQRVLPGVMEIVESPYRNILVVGHAMVNRAILGQLLNMGPIPARKFRMENCGYSIFYIYDTPDGRHIAVETWNSRSHLKK